MGTHSEYWLKSIQAQGKFPNKSEHLNENECFPAITSSSILGIGDAKPFSD